MAHGRRFSSASQVKARAMGMSASALMCGPSPYFTSTPSRCGCQLPGVSAEARHKQEHRRHQRCGHRPEPGAGARSGSHAHQQVHARDPQRVKQRHVKVVGLDRPEAGQPGDGCGAVAQRGRIDVIEPRAAVPQRLPLRMRPVRGEKARVGDEGALDGAPLVLVLCLEVRPHEHGGVQEDQQKIEQDFLPVGEFQRRFQVSWPGVLISAALR